MAQFLLLILFLFGCPAISGASLSSASPISLTKRISSNINLVKCCPPGQLYKTGLNYCKPSINQSYSDAFLPVKSIRTNETLFHTDLNLSNNRFQLNFGLKSCPKGFLAKTSTRFQFYEDGTLKFDLDGVGYKLNSEEFCIDQTSLSFDDSLIARFCIPSQCDDYDSSGIHCIRKCCPLGSVVNFTSRNCQKHPSSSSFNNDLNQQLREYRTGQSVKLDEFTIADGVPPHCQNDGRQAFSLTQFYLLKDGRMYVPNFPCQRERATEEYCIDHFINDEQSNTIQLEGIRCFTNVFTSTDDGSKRSLQVHPYLLLVSVFFLIATIVVYIVIPEIRDNIHGVSTMCYFACTALFYVSLSMIKLGVGIEQEKFETNSYCIPLAICAHFFFLSTFTWLNVVCFDVWWTFKTLGPIFDGKNRHHFGWRFTIYSIYAWGIPLIIVLVGQILDFIKTESDDDEIIRPNFGFTKCWFMCKEAFLVYLYVPVAVLILFNLIFFCLTAIIFHQSSSDAEFAVGSRNAKQRYCVIFNLFILMGISWTAEVVSFILDGSFYSWFLTDLINSLIGFIIFVNFVCKARIATLLIQHCPCLNRLSSIEFIRRRLMADPRRSSSQTAATISIVQKLRRDSDSSKTSSFHRNNGNDRQQQQQQV